jgi:hypothetical protein
MQLAASQKGPNSMELMKSVVGSNTAIRPGLLTLKR